MKTDRILATLALVMASLLTSVPFAAAATDEATRPAITQDEMQRRTQELMDAVVPGDQRPWKKYYADDCLFFDEKGRSMNKTQLVADVSPMPRGYSGSIKIVNPQSRIIGDTAIFSYDMDESETIFGQKLSARYHATDTWMDRNGSWQIIATQVLRYYEDPAVGTADPKRFAAYVGTYELTQGTTIVVTVDGGALYAQRGTQPRQQLLPEDAEIFFRKGVEGRRLFRVGANGRVEAMIDRRNNEDVLWKKID